MIKVLHVISGLGTGGAEGALYRLLLAEDRTTFESRVVSLTDEGHYGPLLRQAGVVTEVAAMPWGLPTLRFQKRLRELTRDFQPDIVCGWMYRGNLGALWARGALDRGTLVWNIRHSLHHWTRERWLFRLTVLANRFFVERPDLVVYNSESCRQQHREFGFTSRREAVVANGFDLDRFRPDPQQRAQGRREWGLGESDCAVGLLARWHPIKNHAGFFAAAATALAAHPQTVFVLAGEGIDGENSELRALVDRHGLGERVRLLGHVGSIDRVIVSLDLLVSASWGEAFPNVVGEALACGVPCLATDVGESKALVGNAGMVVDHGHLAEALVSLLALGTAGLGALGARGREQMVQSFHHRTMVDRYEALLRNLSGDSA